MPCLIRHRSLNQMLTPCSWTPHQQPKTINFYYFTQSVIVVWQHKTDYDSLIFFKTGYHYVAQACLQLTVLLPKSPRCWDYRYALLCQAQTLAQKSPLTSSLLHTLIIVSSRVGHIFPSIHLSVCICLFSLPLSLSISELCLSHHLCPSHFPLSLCLSSMSAVWLFLGRHAHTCIYSP